MDTRDNIARLRFGTVPELEALQRAQRARQSLESKGRSLDAVVDGLLGEYQAKYPGLEDALRNASAAKSGTGKLKKP